jgi:hypothetical protein
MAMKKKEATIKRDNQNENSTTATSFIEFAHYIVMLECFNTTSEYFGHVVFSSTLEGLAVLKLMLAILIGTRIRSIIVPIQVKERTILTRLDSKFVLNFIFLQWCQITITELDILQVYQVILRASQIQPNDLLKTHPCVSMDFKDYWT